MQARSRLRHKIKGDRIQMRPGGGVLPGIGFELSGMASEERVYCFALHFSGNHSSEFVFFHIGPRDFRIMRENREPFFRHGLCVVILFALDGF